MIIKLILVFLESNSLVLIELCADSNYVIFKRVFFEDTSFAYEFSMMFLRIALFS